MAIGVEVGDLPTGLALGRIPGPGAAELLSLFVAPAFRGQGLGLALLEHLEEALIARQCRVASGVFMDGTPAARALERILAAAGWEPPVARMLIGRAQFPGLVLPTWVDRLAARPPAGAELFGWADLSAVERARLEGPDLRQYPAFLSPFAEADRMEPMNSVGLRLDDGAIAGWMITHRLDRETIRYSKLFVREDLQGTGAGAVLLAEAIRRQAASSVPGVSFGVMADNDPMLRLVRRWLSPIMSEVRFTHGTRKILALPHL